MRFIYDDELFEEQIRVFPTILTADAVSGIHSIDALEPIETKPDLNSSTRNEPAPTTKMDDPVLSNSSSPSTTRRQKSQIEEPGEFDVLCGRGRPYQSHLGNQMLHKIVDMNAPRYHCAKRNERRSVATELVNAIKSNNSRFLRQEEEDQVSDSWTEVSDAVAIDKVCHCFRSRRAKSMTFTKLSQQAST
jgi:hypothetical protein